VPSAGPRKVMSTTVPVAGKPTVSIDPPVVARLKKSECPAFLAP
jgi:hypothetical protein